MVNKPCLLGPCIFWRLLGAMTDLLTSQGPRGSRAESGNLYQGFAYCLEMAEGENAINMEDSSAISHGQKPELYNFLILHSSL